MRKMDLTVALAVALGVVAAGCDVKPAPPLTARGERVEFIQVNPQDPAEVLTVGRYMSARDEYDHRLGVLEAYYLRMGNAVKLNWARNERQNLAQAQQFSFRDAPSMPMPAGQRVEGADEHLLVERAVQARQDYLRALQELLDHYRDAEADLEAALVRNVQERFDPVKTYMYFLNIEIPGPDHRPERVEPAAQQLFERAMRLYRRSPLVRSYSDQRQALDLLLELARQYPDSLQAADAAFFIAEIYSRTFGEHVRAVHWYERAFTWDPRIDQPARYNAALVYDYQLSNPEQAINLYRASILHDPPNQRRRHQAQARIHQLTEGAF